MLERKFLQLYVAVVQMQSRKKLILATSSSGEDLCAIPAWVKPPALDRKVEILAAASFD